MNTPRLLLTLGLLLAALGLATPSADAAGLTLPECRAYGKVVFKAKPRSWSLSCAGDLRSSLSKLRWTGWGRSTAVARGKFSYNTCRPSCADANYKTVSATLRVWSPGNCGGRRVYTRARVPSSAKDYNFARDVDCKAFADAASAATANALDLFKTPTGNIVCAISSGSVDCTIGSGLKPAPKTPTCEYGDPVTNRIALSRTGRAKRVPCAGDPGPWGVRENASVLGYGRSVTRGRMRCTSQERGLTCRNRTNGFFLSRTDWRFF